MKRLGLTAIAVAIAMTAAGCAPQGGNPDDTAGGGTLDYVTRYAVPGGYDHLTNPDNGLPGFVSLAYSKLVKYQTGPDIQGAEIGADLAEDWDISDDGLTYTFHLDPDARFHDIEPVSGRGVTADDVVASFEAIVENQARSAYMFDVVESMEAIDDHTFELTLSQPHSSILQDLAKDSNFIVPVEGIEGDYDMSTTIIGSGPFVADEIDPETVWRWVKNPDYYHEGLPRVDEVNFVVVSDPAASLAALRSGQVNLSPVDQQSDVDALVATGEFETVNQLFGPEFLYLNPAVAPFDDIRVRHAIAMAIDFEGMGAAIRGEGAYSLTSVVPPQFGGVGEDELREIRPYDPARAEQLLAEAGYPDGFASEFLVQNFFKGDLEAQWIVEDLKKVGIDLTIAQVDPATYNNRQRSGEFGMLRGLRTITGAEQYLQDFASDSPTNYTRTSDPKVDEFIAQFQAERDENAQKEIVAEFTRYWETEVATVIAGPMAYYSWVWSTDVDNQYTSTSGLSGNVFGYGTWFEEISVSQ